MDHRTDPTPRLEAEILETAMALNRVGAMSDTDLAEIRRLQRESALGRGIALRHMRDHAGLDREAFGELIGLSASRIARFERGEAVPKGPAAKLIDLIRRKGIDAVR